MKVNSSSAHSLRIAPRSKSVAVDEAPVDRVTLSAGVESFPVRLNAQSRASRAWLSESQEQQQTGELVSHFPDRNGYDLNFLGVPVSLPVIDPSMRDQVATLIGAPNQSELKYTNFSVVMNKDRRQAFYAVVNIDGGQLVDMPRDGKWSLDGRLPRHYQLGNEAYRRNDIDRGHLVRRSDAVWGPDAQQASRDTFVYTNSGLQHADLNQKTWLELENFILDQARSKGLKLTVMTGPVFSPDDPSFDNNGQMNEPTQIPQEFWKVVYWNDPKDGLKSAGFLQSQKDHIGRGLFQSQFDPSGMSVYQMPMTQLEKITRLDFPAATDTAAVAKSIRSPEQANLF